MVDAAPWCQADSEEGIPISPNPPSDLVTRDWFQDLVAPFRPKPATQPKKPNAQCRARPPTASGLPYSNPQFQPPPLVRPKKPKKVPEPPKDLWDGQCNDPNRPVPSCCNEVRVDVKFPGKGENWEVCTHCTCLAPPPFPGSHASLIRTGGGRWRAATLVVSLQANRRDRDESQQALQR